MPRAPMGKILPFFNFRYRMEHKGLEKPSQGKQTKGDSGQGEEILQGKEATRQVTSKPPGHKVFTLLAWQDFMIALCHDRCMPPVFWFQIAIFCCSITGPSIYIECGGTVDTDIFSFDSYLLYSKKPQKDMMEGISHLELLYFDLNVVCSMYN